MLECLHLHLWLALAQWGRMSCCISCDVQKWECTTAFTELHALHWSQRETISPQQGTPFLTETIQMQNHMEMGPDFHRSTWRPESRRNKRLGHYLEFAVCSTLTNQHFVIIQLFFFFFYSLSDRYSCPTAVSISQLSCRITTTTVT